jgi:hypothetical protein
MVPRSSEALRHYTRGRVSHTSPPQFLYNKPLHTVATAKPSDGTEAAKSAEKLPQLMTSRMRAMMDLSKYTILDMYFILNCLSLLCYAL